MDAEAAKQWVRQAGDSYAFDRCGSPAERAVVDREVAEVCAVIDGAARKADCGCDGNPSGGSCRYPDCQMEPPPTAELLPLHEGETFAGLGLTLAELARSELSLIRFAHGNEPPTSEPFWPPRVAAMWHLAKGVQRLLAERRQARNG